MSRLMNTVYKNVPKLYFAWMYSSCVGWDNQEPFYPQDRSWEKLIKKLDSITYRYSVPLDVNRALDGARLREEWGYETHRDSSLAGYTNRYACTVLEMMLALARRCEYSVMYNPEYGDRTRVWFYNMLYSMGLEDQDDQNYNDEYVTRCIDTMLDREYSSDGRGGLYTVENSPMDFRLVEVWDQMCLYLRDYVNKGMN